MIGEDAALSFEFAMQEQRNSLPFPTEVCQDASSLCFEVYGLILALLERIMVTSS